jgi:lysophospholipase L1-like esterase
MMMYRVLIFATILSLINGAIVDDVYVENLASNIEKSGLLKNFGQSWKEHLDTWNSFQRANDGQPTDGSLPCNTSREDNRPTFSVHRLHPADIGIVGALGASFVAGSGAGAKRLMEVTMQYRGVSFPIGGDENLTTTETLPNILKKFNPLLRGFSRGIAPVWFEELSQFNVAVPGASSDDLEDQAKELVKRIKAMTGASEQWKVISIYVGVNDLCDACEKRIGGRASTYGRRVKNAVDKLEKELTKTIVNLIALPPLHQWYTQLHDDPVCHALHKYLCPCIMKAESDNLSKEYNNELYGLPERYNERVDFAVVVQPFMSGLVTFPKDVANTTNQTDQSFFAPDCFHFNRRGHAAAARALWTNMLQAVGDKDITMNFDKSELSCPDEECPYIRTWLNSNNCSRKKHHPIPTLPPIIGNHTWNWNWTDHIKNFTDHLQNYTDQFHNLTENFTAHFTLKPWNRNFIGMAQSKEIGTEDGYGYGSIAWIAFGVILSMSVVAMAIAGVISYNKRRIQNTPGQERTPLLTGGQADRIY